MIVKAFNHRGEVRLDLLNVLYCFASDDNVYAVTEESDFKLNEKLYDIETDERFIRINKSEVVNITKIKDALPLFNSRIRLKLIDGSTLYVNRTYLSKFKACLTGGIK